MKTIKVEIPEGYEAESFDDKTAEVKLRPKGMKRGTDILTIDDLLTANGLTQEQFDQQCEGLDPDEKAYRIIKLLAKTLNEGWIPNWDNSNENKYFPWFYMDGGSSGFRFGGRVIWLSHSSVGSRLCFKSSAMANHAGRNFTEVYKRLMVIE